jgi:glycosyltransferase involved in cell wall biosynthesis
MISVFSITFNEEILIEFMIHHYRTRFPGCHIVIYDNNSTDNTVEIAKANGCEIIYYNSGNTLNDILHMRIKNTCWKDAKTDWVLVCDLDELLDINEQQLKNEESLGTTIIKSEGWTMINMENNLDIKNIKHGYRTEDELFYDKCLLFNKKHINQINYFVGAHQCNPVGLVKYGNIYKMYHYRFINPDIEVAKVKLNANRLSDDNKIYNMGVQRYSMTEEQVRADFQGRRSCGKILP